MEDDRRTLLELVQELSRLAAVIEAKCCQAHTAGNDTKELTPALRKEPSIRFGSPPQPSADQQQQGQEVQQPKLGSCRAASNESLLLSQGTSTAQRTPPGLKKSGSSISSPSIDSNTTFDLRFRLHYPWQDKAGLEAAKKLPTNRTNETWSFNRDRPRKEDSVLQRFVISPNSKGKLIWDLFGFTLIAYEIIALPLQFFGPPRFEWMTFLAWLSPIYWFFDMCLCFVVAFHDSKYGDLETRPSKIRRHYMISFFWIDALCIIVDVLSLAIATDMYKSRESLIRLVKVLKLTRLLRIFKFEARLRGASERMRLYMVIPVSASVAQILMQVMIFCHYVACIWYGIGAVNDMTDGTLYNWVEVHRIEHRTLLYRYLVCLHWALSHFAPSTTNIFPSNSVEHAYAVVTSLVAMMVFSSMVGNMTSKIVELREGRQKRRREEAQIAAYMVRHHVSPTTRAFIMQFLLTRRQTVQSDALNPELVTSLPDYLQNKLRFEVYCNVMRASPILWGIVSASPRRSERLCSNGTREQSFDLGNELFIFGQQADNMYIFTKGCLAYSFGDRASVRNLDILSKPGALAEANYLVPPVQCGPESGNTVAAECALWVTWRHRGGMVATTYAEYVSVDVKNFLLIMRHEALAWRYSQAMYKYLVECPEEACTDVISNTEKLDEMLAEAQDASIRPASLRNMSKVVAEEGDSDLVGDDSLGALVWECKQTIVEI